MGDDGISSLQGLVRHDLCCHHGHAADIDEFFVKLPGDLAISFRDDLKKGFRRRRDRRWIGVGGCFTETSVAETKQGNNWKEKREFSRRFHFGKSFEEGLIHSRAFEVE